MRYGNKRFVSFKEAPVDDPARVIMFEQRVLGEAEKRSSYRLQV